MKARKGKPTFEPIELTIESLEECEILIEALDVLHGVTIGNKCGTINDIMNVIQDANDC